MLHFWNTYESILQSPLILDSLRPPLPAEVYTLCLLRAPQLCGHTYSGAKKLTLVLFNLCSSFFWCAAVIAKRSILMKRAFLLIVEAWVLTPDVS